MPGILGFELFVCGFSKRNSVFCFGTFQEGQWRGEDKHGEALSDET